MPISVLIHVLKGLCNVDDQKGSPGTRAGNVDHQKGSPRKTPPQNHVCSCFSTISFFSKPGGSPGSLPQVLLKKVVFSVSRAVRGRKDRAAPRSSSTVGGGPTGTVCAERSGGIRSANLMRRQLSVQQRRSSEAKMQQRLHLLEEELPARGPANHQPRDKYPRKGGGFLPRGDHPITWDGEREALAKADTHNKCQQETPENTEERTGAVARGEQTWTWLTQAAGREKSACKCPLGPACPRCGYGDAAGDAADDEDRRGLRRRPGKRRSAGRGARLGGGRGDARMGGVVSGSGPPRQQNLGRSKSSKRDETTAHRKGNGGQTPHKTRGVAETHQGGCSRRQRRGRRGHARKHGKRGPSYTAKQERKRTRNGGLKRKNKKLEDLEGQKKGGKEDRNNKTK